MRICFLSSDFTPEGPTGGGGGIETYVRLISRGLAAHGHDVHLVLPTTTASRRLMDGAVTVHAIRVPDEWSGTLTGYPESRAALSFAWHAARKVRGLIAEGGPFEIVEAPEYKGQGAYLAQDPSIPLVIKCHAHLLFCLTLNRTALTADTALVSDLERETLECARAVNANSRFLAARCTGDYDLNIGVPPHVAYGIDTERFQPTTSGLRARLGLGARPTILFAGRMEERKGLSTLVRAFAAVARRRSDVVLLLAGGDVSGAGGRSNAAWMCEEWGRLGVPSDRFLFLGNISHDQMPSVYSAADLLVAPSPLEAFGFVYLEAMACGCPPIGCTTGGAPEIIDHSHTGLLVPPDNAPALERAIETLIDDRDWRAALGARGRTHVLSHYSLDAMVRRTETFYRETAA
jgi:glycosyltransferase involved in cell wall biosynthesis